MKLTCSHAAVLGVTLLHASWPWCPCGALEEVTLASDLQTRFPEGLSQALVRGGW